MNENAKPIIMDGSIGCGKTMGVYSLLEHMGMDCTHIDITDVTSPANPNDITSLAKCLAKTKIIPISDKPVAWLIDDVEGFLACKTLAGYADVLIGFLKQKHSGRRPILMTCNDYFSLPALRKLVESGHVSLVRMRAPSRLAAEKYVSLRTDQVPPEWARRVIADNGNDLRQIRLNLEALRDKQEYRLGRGEPFDAGAEPLNGAADRSTLFFQSFDKLVRQVNTVDEWARDTGDKTELMIYSNYPHRVDTCEKLSRMADALSLSDTRLPPDKAELPGLKDELLGGFMRENVTKTSYQPRAVLKPYPRKGVLKKRSGKDSSERPVSLSFQMDMPSSLGGVSM